ncbi:MAG: tripartite tricarboxylate transporter permease [Streptosporangiales bacterium]|nr:tripartite tricarboxylate transporter permease [Streptosporangiales bacterium]
MADTLSALLSGFATILTPINIAAVFVGVVIGNLIGVLPGLGPTASMSLLLPVTFYLEPTTAIVMLAGIYYGSMYGGTITSVLLNIPGEATAIVTAFDGHPLAKKGRAGAALCIGALASFVGSLCAVVAMVFLAQVLADFGLRFGPPEICAIMLFALTLVSSLTQGSFRKAMIMTAAGLLLTTVGTDMFTGDQRFTFDFLFLQDGFNLVVVIMGLFGISEILMSLRDQRTTPISVRLREMVPTGAELRASLAPVARGTGTGMILGLVPGAGALLSSFASYSLEKRVAKQPARFGKGAIEGVAGPEAANNAGSTSAFVPMLSLGTPTTATTAVLLGALMINGVEPGPLLIDKAPEVVWGLMASMFLGNIMLVILNIPLIRVWTKLLEIPFPVLYPILLVIIGLGTFALNNSVADVIAVAIFGVLGYFARVHGYPLAPLVLAFVIGNQFESSLRQSLTLSQGSFAIFFTRPLSLAILIGTVVLSALFVVLAKRSRIRTEDED